LQSNDYFIFSSLFSLSAAGQPFAVEKKSTRPDFAFRTIKHLWAVASLKGPINKGDAKSSGSFLPSSIPNEKIFYIVSF